MAEKIVLETEIKTGNSTNSVKGLKAELRELTKQLGTLEQGSQAFNDAAKRAGQLKEQIRGINDAISDADPEKAFGPFSRTVAGLAGGFSAAQGAMALFGSESEELEKTLVRVQGAMALSQGINSLLEFRNDFKDLGKIVSGQVVKAFTTLRGALIATGIGALVVTIGTLIANWKEFSRAITEAFPSFKVVTDFFNNFRQIGVGTLKAIVESFKVIGDVVAKLFKGEFSEAIDAAKGFGARVATAYNEGFAEEDRKVKIENSLKQRKFELDLEEAKGKDIRTKRVKLLKDELSILEKGSDEYNAKLIEIEKLRSEIRDEAIEKEKERQKKLKEEEEKRFNAYLERLKKELEADLAIADAKLKKAREAYEESKNSTDRQVSDIERLREKALKAVNDEKLSFEVRKQILDEYLKAGYISQKEYSDASIALTKAEEIAKLNSIQMVSNALSGFIALAGEQTAAGKALAVAQTTIDTYVAAVRAYKSALDVPVIGTYLAPVAAASAVAAGLANVRRILSVQVPGGGGGGGSVPSAPNMSVPRMTATGNQVSGAGAVSLNSQPQTKVYVVESDIRRVQNKVEVIENNARIG